MSNDLTECIRTLSPTEKRYLRIFATRHLGKTTARYLRLFDTFLDRIDRLESLPAFSAAEGNYLYRFILKGLRSYHEGHSVDILLKEQLINVVLLWEKRLYVQAQKEIERAKKIAWKYERLAVLLEILLLQQTIVIEHNARSMHDDLTALTQETKATLKKLNEFTRLRILKDQAFTLLRGHYFSRDEEINRELKAIARESEEIPREPGMTSEILRSTIMANVSIGGGNFQQAMMAYDNVISLWERNPERLKEDVIQYKKFLANYLMTCHALSLFEKIPEIVGKMQNIPCRSAEEEAEQFQNIYYVQLLYKMNTGRFDDFDVFVNELEKGLRKYNTKINEARRLMLYYNIGIAYFILHRWKDCFYWNNLIVEHGRTDHRKDIQRTSRLLRLVILLEQGKYDLLEYELINTERYFRQRKMWFRYESVIVKTIKRLLTVDDPDKTQVLHKFESELCDLSEGKTSAALPGITELLFWVRHHIHRCSMLELIFGDGVPKS